MSKITELLDLIPALGLGLELRSEYIDPTTGITITQIGKSTFRSALQVNTSVGPVNIPFDLPGETLEEARAGWRASATAAVKEFLLQLEERHRRIVLPGGDASRPPFQRSPA